MWLEKKLSGCSLPSMFFCDCLCPGPQASAPLLFRLELMARALATVLSLSASSWSSGWKASCSTSPLWIWKGKEPYVHDQYLAQGRFRWDERKPVRDSRQPLMDSVSLPRTVPRDQSRAQRRLKKPGPPLGLRSIHYPVWLELIINSKKSKQMATWWVSISNMDTGI